MNTLKEKLTKLWSFARERALAVHGYFTAHANIRTLIILAALFVGGVGAYVSLIMPPSDFPSGRLVTIPEGETLAGAASLLKEAHVVRSAKAFTLYQRIRGRAASVHAGDYLFKTPTDMFAVGRAIATGAYGMEPLKVRIPEGATVAEIANMLAPKFERFDRQRFLDKALPLEGTLFPDTYFFMPNATDETVLAAMTKNFETAIEPVRDEIALSGHSLHDVLVMASLLEREARTTYDRRMIAGVLWNRLDKNMLLQVDAAFLYTLGKGTFDLTLADLKSDSPYNTYKNKGLPPTPIGNPSLDSIRAAVSPIKHKYLFYLADNNGVTYYSATYAEHMEKKRQHLGS